MTKHKYLKPCPFCGGNAMRGQIKDGDYFVACLECRTTSGYCPSLAKITEMWNARTHEATDGSEAPQVVTADSDSAPSGTEPARPYRCDECSTHEATERERPDLIPDVFYWPLTGKDELYNGLFLPLRVPVIEMKNAVYRFDHVISEEEAARLSAPAVKTKRPQPPYRGREK